MGGGGMGIPESCRENKMVTQATSNPLSLQTLLRALL